MGESDASKKLREFHRVFELPAYDLVGIPSEKRRKLRVALINEEAREFQEASEKQDPVEVADALADLLYVTYGAALEWGIPLDAVFDEVHRSNMTKKWPDGTVHRRADGKILKPDTYSPADVAGVLRSAWRMKLRAEEEGVTPEEEPAS